MSGDKFFVLLGITTLVGLICLVFAAIYDIQAARRYKAVERYRAVRPRPHVTFMIYQASANDELLSCIRSIRRLNYRHYDIVVYVDSVATQLVKTQAKLVSNLARTYIARKAVTKATLIRNAYRRSQQGEYVILLDATTPIDARSLGRTIDMMSLHQAIDGIVFSSTAYSIGSLSQLVAMIHHLTQRTINKALMALGLYHHRRLSSGALYRKQAIFQTSRRRIIYDKYLRVRSLQLMTNVGLLIACMLTAVFVYAGILAASLEAVTPLVSSWLLVVVWVCAVVWSDDTLRLRCRLDMTLSLPVSYFAIVGVTTISIMKKLLNLIFSVFYVRYFAYNRRTS